MRGPWGIEVGSVNVYGRLWSPPSPISLSRRFFSSTFRPLAVKEEGAMLFGRQDKAVAIAAARRAAVSAVARSDPLCAISRVFNFRVHKNFVSVAKEAFRGFF